MEAKTYHVFTFDSSPDPRGFMDDRSGSSLPAEDVLSSRSAYCSGCGWGLDVSRAVVAPAISSNGFYLGGFRPQRSLKIIRVLVATLSLISATAASADKHFADRRERMLNAVQTMARAVPSHGTEISPAVLEAMREVPRHELVPAKVRDDAYENHPLFIGHGQTISQPYIVALMTSLARPAKDHVVLEVGTGSGYQAAVLSRLVARVYTIEIVEPLAQEAAANLKRIGYDNVMVRAGDGYKGWAEHAPFDAIVVTAAANHVPQPLVDQLKRGGRLVIPVGGTSMSQNLMVIEKDERGKAHNRAIIPVRFVPLTGEGEGGPPGR